MGTEQRPVITLAEHRLRKLRLPQAEIARRTKKGQGAVSTLEKGKLPRPWNWDVWMAAYGISDPDEFRYLVENALKLKALQKPISETEPLLALTLNEPTIFQEVRGGGMSDSDVSLPPEVYQEHGFSNRAEYLVYLAEEFGADNVRALTSVMPASEDFDGLVTMLEDQAEAEFDRECEE